MTVIVGVSKKVNHKVYHSDVCHHVHELGRKRYIPESEAKKRGLTECEYCSGAFDGNKKSGSKLSYKLRDADPSEVLGE